MVDPLLTKNLDTAGPWCDLDQGRERVVFQQIPIFAQHDVSYTTSASKHTHLVKLVDTDLHKYSNVQ